MTLSDIMPGTKLEIEMVNYEGERIGPVLVSELEWIEEGEEAFIAAPIYEGIIYPIRIGTKVNLFFICNVDMFKCTATIIHRGVKDNLAMLKVKKTSEMEKIQRRQFFRFECSRPVKYREVKTLNPKKNEDIPFIKGVSIDMSGGGVSIATEDSVEKESLLECELILSPEKTVKFFGKPVRVSRRDTDQKYKYDIGLVFDKIENRDREEVIKFIFMEQRILIKKGLIY